ncbi:ABC transporter substrate-binding protein [Enterococcus sp. HY326]|uniref:ABC transporter substrate-binding protein n=1 Tax=Enterococcus sp. HY326 TaxID=2971265 RepID=UPI00223E995F|nr:ABC transporter substrate-binding protein [Enterococcus sp. HY326]
MKKLVVLLFFFLFLNGCSTTTTTADSETDASTPRIVIGFSQLGTESNWRKQHTESVQTELEKEGYEVLYRNAYLSLEQQIQDIRSFISYNVDIIVLSPLQESGWDDILLEAQKADIPVFVVDRSIEVSQETLKKSAELALEEGAGKELMVTHIGPSFKAEGNRAGLYVSNYFRNQEYNEIKVLELTGNVNASPTILRSEGFSETIQRNYQDNQQTIQVVDSISGDFIRRKGKEAMADYIAQKDISQIDVLFSQSDEMTLGAMEALGAAGVTPGKDIIIVSIDAQKNMIDKLKAGEVNCVVECNPNQGIYVRNAIKRFLEGKTDLPKEIYVHETVFSDDMDFSQIPPRNY